MELGYLTPDDILTLPRHRVDPVWEETRQMELRKRAGEGSTVAAAALQIPIPKRAEELKLMEEISEREEAHMAAYEKYRKENNARKLRDQAQYEKDEEERLHKRLAWYRGGNEVIRKRRALRAKYGWRRVPTKAWMLKQSRKIASRKTREAVLKVVREQVAAKGLTQPTLQAAFQAAREAQHSVKPVPIIPPVVTIPKRPTAANMQ